MEVRSLEKNERERSLEENERDSRDSEENEKDIRYCYKARNKSRFKSLNTNFIQMNI